MNALDATHNRRPFKVDLHLHTTRGSFDSNLEPHELIAQARSAGLDAVCITEHDFMWDGAELADAAAQAGLLVLRGMEVTTELGHIGVFGLEGYIGGIYKLAELRRIADDQGALLIANHPFRYRLDPRLSFLNRDRQTFTADDVAAAAGREIFTLVDAIEVINGACSADENRVALEVARALHLAQVAGSDSHSRDSIGCAYTVLDAVVRDEQALIEAIKRRQCHAAR